MRPHAPRLLCIGTAMILAVPSISFALDGTFRANLIAAENAGLPGQSFNEAITLHFAPVAAIGPIEFGLLTTTVPDDDPLDDFAGIGDGSYLAIDFGVVNILVARTDYYYFPDVPSRSAFQGITVNGPGSTVLVAFGNIITYCGNATFCIPSEAMIIGAKE